MLKPIEGSFEQCLNHYRKHGNDESFAKLGTMIKVKSQTPRRWFTGIIRPVGEYKIRVGQALTDMGYGIREIREMPKLLQEAHALIAYGLAGIDDTAAGFSMTTPSARDMLLSILLGKQGMSDERLAHGERFIAPLRAGLANARAKFAPVAPEQSGKPAAPASERETARLTTAPPPELLKDHDAVAAWLAAMLLSSYPLLQYVNSDNFTPEERKKLRERLGFFGAMNISTELNRLCSEKARTQFEGTMK